MGVIALAAGCKESEQVSDFTGNETTYALTQASTYKISGSITFRERKDGSTSVQVNLTGTEGDVKYPVHLHLGDITAPSADVAALLSPVYGKTGASNTNLSQLADETKVTYAALIKLNACIKVHLSDTGAERNVILAAGNIGEAAANTPANGRIGISVCKSE